MPPPRCPLWLVLLAAAIQVVGAARATLPAQDGLKFFRVAREFRSQPWPDVIRHCDQHPLYPICVSAAEPAVAAIMGHGPGAWRVAGQSVSIAAFLAAIFPVFGLARALFDERTATLAAMMFALLPSTTEVGHDTLSDALALCALAWSLRLGERALRTHSLAEAIGCGLAGGIGFWARPEVLLAPAAVGLVALFRALFSGRAVTAAESPVGWSEPREAHHLGADPGPSRSARTALPSGLNGELTAGISSRLLPRLAAIALPSLAMVGGYTMVKGEVSERLALRLRAVATPMPAAPAADGPGFDFAPKEESAAKPVDGVRSAAYRVLAGWAEGLGFALGVAAIWGATRAGSASGRSLMWVYMGMLTSLLVLHAATVGYLSSRHTLGLVVASLPWASAGSRSIVRGMLGRVERDESTIRRRCLLAMAALTAVAVVVQAHKPPHPSRWGHLAAGRWLQANARSGEAVLDTRGWAAFIAGGPSYDCWHVRQALSDARLRYVVVGADELRAGSRRAATLRALLASAATPVASFPARAGGTGADVQVYRYQRPSNPGGLPP